MGADWQLARSPERICDLLSDRCNDRIREMLHLTVLGEPWVGRWQQQFILNNRRVNNI
jgi:hypothetical protein